MSIDSAKTVVADNADNIEDGKREAGQLYEIEQKPEADNKQDLWSQVPAFRSMVDLNSDSIAEDRLDLLQRNMEQTAKAARRSWREDMGHRWTLRLEREKERAVKDKIESEREIENLKDAAHQMEIERVEMEGQYQNRLEVNQRAAKEMMEAAWRETQRGMEQWEQREMAEREAAERVWQTRWEEQQHVTAANHTEAVHKIGALMKEMQQSAVERAEEEQRWKTLLETGVVDAESGIEVLIQELRKAAAERAEAEQRWQERLEGFMHQTAEAMKTTQRAWQEETERWIRQMTESREEANRRWQEQMEQLHREAMRAMTTVTAPTQFLATISAVCQSCAFHCCTCSSRH